MLNFKFVLSSRVRWHTLVAQIWCKMSWTLKKKKKSGKENLPGVGGLLSAIFCSSKVEFSVIMLGNISSSNPLSKVWVDILLVAEDTPLLRFPLSLLSECWEPERSVLISPSSAKISTLFCELILANFLPEPFLLPAEVGLELLLRFAALRSSVQAWLELLMTLTLSFELEQPILLSAKCWNSIKLWWGDVDVRLYLCWSQLDLTLSSYGHHLIHR